MSNCIPAAYSNRRGVPFTSDQLIGISSQSLVAFDCLYVEPEPSECQHFSTTTGGRDQNPAAAREVLVDRLALPPGQAAAVIRVILVHLLAIVVSRVHVRQIGMVENAQPKAARNRLD